MGSILSLAFYIFISLLVFSLVIFAHELGHFLTAKLFKVRVVEFALGMGPAVFKRQKSKESTVYSLRLFPIGGFCAMEGEDDEASTDNSFGAKPVWQRVIILAAGAVMNFLAGLAILLVLYSSIQSFPTTTIERFLDGFPYEAEQMLLPGDKILEINDYPIYLYGDLQIFLDREAGSPYDFLVLRGGEKILLSDVPLEKQMYMTANGEGEYYGLVPAFEQATPFAKAKVALLNAVDFIRLIKVSIFDLAAGNAGVNELSGPVGMVGQITETAKRSAADTWFFVALISINLGVMNLLPLPALDGGRIFFLLIEFVRRKPMNPKYEGMIHFVGLALLMLLMVYVSYNDIVRMVTG